MIGITGGIGSGKSTIARELAQRGYTVYDCDQEAKRIIDENIDVQKAIIALLGEEAFADGLYNTAYVAKRVFADPELLERLNAIVHPAVKEDILLQKPDFVESAILYEARLDALCDKVVVVDAPEDIRIARTIRRDYHGEMTETNINKVRARIRTQSQCPIPPTAIHIHNDGRRTIESLVDELLTKL